MEVHSVSKEAARTTFKLFGTTIGWSENDQPPRLRVEALTITLPRLLVHTHEDSLRYTHKGHSYIHTHKELWRREDTILHDGTNGLLLHKFLVQLCVCLGESGPQHKTTWIIEWIKSFHYEEVFKRLSN